MSKVRIEIHFTEEEVKEIDEIAQRVSRSRKNFCENAVRKEVLAQASTR